MKENKKILSIMAEDVDDLIFRDEVYYVSEK